LEKIEMKKTLVAVAAMAAVTGAMADATIYGTIDQAYESTKATSGTTTTKTTKINGTWNGGSALGFKGSEDLGGGMKAYFQQEIGLSTDQNDTSYENRLSFIGLSGGFGDVKMGRGYNFAFFNAIANDPLGFSGTGGYAVGYGGAGEGMRNSNMIVYTTPTLAPGLNVQASKVMGEAGTTAAAPTKTGDSTGYALNYTTGALYAGITGETVTETATTKTKNSTTTITYDLGMVKVGYGAGKTTLGTTYTKAGAMSITVPLGAVTLGYSSGDVKAKASATAAETTTKYSQYGAMYALSKRTNAYLHTGKQSATASSQNVYAIGLKHDF